MTDPPDLTREDVHRIQIQEILTHKWLESEKVGYDLGDAAVLDWISRYAALFREYWERQLAEGPDIEPEEEEEERDRP